MSFFSIWKIAIRRIWKLLDLFTMCLCTVILNYTNESINFTSHYLILKALSWTIQFDVSTIKPSIQSDVYGIVTCVSCHVVVEFSELNKVMHSHVSWLNTRIRKMFTFAYIDIYIYTCKHGSTYASYIQGRSISLMRLNTRLS